MPHCVFTARCTTALLFVLAVACGRDGERRGPLAELSYEFVGRETEMRCDSLWDPRWPEFGESLACLAEAHGTSGFLIVSADSGFVLETGKAVSAASDGALAALYENELTRAVANLGAGYQLCLESPTMRAHRWQASGYYRTLTLNPISQRVVTSFTYGEPPPESRCP